MPVSNLHTGQLRLDEAAARYVSRVHRLCVGQSLEVFDPEAGVRAEATVEEMGKNSVLLQVGPLCSSPTTSLPVSLIQGLGKGGKPEQVVREATALGVQRVLLVETERGNVRIPQEKQPARRERWIRVAVDAARQSGRGDIPEVAGPVPLALALGEVSEGLRIVLEPGAPPLLSALRGGGLSRGVALLIGPEGGLSPQEVQAAKDVGFVPASLGRNVLRTELATAAVLGALLAEAERTRD